MRKLYDARFPIRRMVPIDAYGASDDRSMNAANTSAFNCRRVAATTSWSQHAYGGAIEINPLENRRCTSTGACRHTPPPPPLREPLAAREGMIHDGDVVVRAFASIGWQWGGRWRKPRDYQHIDAR